MRKISIQIENVTVEEFSASIAKVFEEKIKALLPPTSPEIIYLTRKEASDKLRVSLVTLNDWTKKGYIKAMRIGSRVRYKSTEIERALKEIESSSFKANVK